MKINAIGITFLILIIHVNIISTRALFYNISRTRPHGNNGWKNGVDHFTIPTSMCHHNSEPHECSFFNAINIINSNCSCMCRPTKTTFAFYENQWQCLENSEVRTNLQSAQYSKPGERGCSQDMKTLFVNEYSNTSLPVLNLGEERAISTLASSWSNCEVDLNYSWYFGCEDSRLSSIHYLNVLKNLLTLDKMNSHYILKVSSKKNVSDAHLLSGRIINLGIFCTSGAAAVIQRRCLLFKLQGSITCLDTSPATTTEKTVATTQSKTVSGTRIKPALETSSTRPIPTAPARTVWTERAGNQTNPSPNSTSIQTIVPRSRPGPNDRERGGDRVSISSLGFIAAITVSVILVLFLIGFVVTRCSLLSKNGRTNNRQEETQMQDAVAVSTLSNLALQSDDQHSGYFTLRFSEPAIYASNYQVPLVNRKSSFNAMTNPLEDDSTTGHLYEPLDVPKEQNISGPQSKADNGPNKNNHLNADNASTFQKYGPINLEQRVYNLVEDLPTPCPGEAVNDGPNDGSNGGPSGGLNNGPSGSLNSDSNRAEPVYHVIEGPFHAVKPDPRNSLCTEGPVYCTLEELYTDASNNSSYC